MSECHGHSLPQTFHRAFMIAIVANSVFVVVQMWFAYLAHSTSLFADAVHNLGDVFSLIVAWLGNRLLKRLPTSSTTYGMKKASILAAFLNVLLLVFTCGVIATEAIYKLYSPVPIETSFVIIVAAIGIVVNATTAMLFLKNGRDLNIRAAYLHLMSDAFVSVGVVVSAVLLRYTGWLWLDPVVGLCIAGVILKGSWRLFKDGFRLIIDGVPSHISVVDVRSVLLSHPGVAGIHDLHIWALSTQENALSVHLWMPEVVFTDEARQQLAKTLRERYDIHHVTIQVERLENTCADACLCYL